MSMAQGILGQLAHEVATTRRVLERLPEDKFDWTPHPKSMTARRLASHIAEIPGWAGMVMGGTSVSFDPAEFKPWHAASVVELLDKLHSGHQGAIASISPAKDEDFMVIWSLKVGNQEVFNAPRIAAIHGFIISHMIHHRAQLALYLRLLDVPVPSIYGPSADEPV